MGCLVATLGLIAVLLLGVRTSVDVAGTWSPWTPTEIEVFASPAPLALEPPSGSGPRACGQYRFASSDRDEAGAASIDEARRVIEARLRAVGVPDPIVSVADQDLVTVEAVGDAGSLRELILTPGHVAFLPVPPELDADVADGQPVPSGMVDLEPLFATDGVASARAVRDDSGIPAIELTLTDEAARSLDDHAAGHQGERFAIVVDGVVGSAPVIRARSFDGEARISGSWSLDEALLMAAILGAGPLPAPLDEVRLDPCD
jgi:preprotein translocase subunit SecD